MKEIIKNLKYIKLSDLLSPLIFILALPCALIFRVINKIQKKEIWLVCENGYTARDNGYHFYKYVREKHPKDACYYVIKKNSNDFNKVKDLGNIIEFKSFKHWIYYLSSKYNISSQKNGNPNQVFFYILHVKLNWFNNRVFLQHGVIKDMCEWLLYKNTKFRYFICGAKKEYEYVRDNYGYPKGYVQYTGLARFDNLHDTKTENNQILIMPTWRRWLGRDTNNFNNTTNFYETDFFKFWNSFLTNQEFINFVEKNNLQVLFYPHINMQKYLSFFKTTSSNIKFLDTNTDIQKVLKSSSLMVTDYSSVFMDFAYMRKPIIFYQFDKEEYRKKQYQEGYFSYEKDGFGPTYEKENDVINYIMKMYKKDFIPEEKYLNRMEEFFELHDKKNCERQYDLLKKESK